MKATRKGHGIETLTRGVCVQNGQLLLCRNRQFGNVYLPGGHVEFGESGAEALAREIVEEMGCVAKVGRFLGCVEHGFDQHGEPHAEINLVYRMRVAGLSTRCPPPCREAWLEFFWQPLDGLRAVRLEPAVLSRRLPGWLASPGNLATTKRKSRS